MVRCDGVDTLHTIHLVRTCAILIRYVTDPIAEIEDKKRRGLHLLPNLKVAHAPRPSATQTKLY